MREILSCRDIFVMRFFCDINEENDIQNEGNEKHKSKNKSPQPKVPIMLLPWLKLLSLPTLSKPKY